MLFLSTFRMLIVHHIFASQVWGLAVSSDERTIVSGAADSVVTFWEDCTEEQESEKEMKRTELALKYKKKPSHFKRV